MIKVNFVQSVSASEKKVVDIENLFQKIKAGEWRDEVDNIQYQISKREVSKADSLKKSLPAFTISATYNDRRKVSNVESYTGLIHLDYDKLNDVQEVKSKLTKQPHVYATFISPSGKGLKVFVQCDNDKTQHEAAFNKIKQYYDELLDIKSDSNVKDILRLSFVSYDPDLYLNKDSEVFRYQNLPTNANQTQSNIDWVWDFTSKRQEFTEGNRNNFIYSFACNANRYDCDINEVLEYAYTYSEATFAIEEIEKSIRSAYDNQIFEKGSKSLYTKSPNPISAISANSDISLDDNDQESEAPYIPDYIYDTLHPTLRDACNVFKGRERDVFFTSAISVISGGLYNVSGLYAQEVRYPNLFTIIIAPPASGKSSMKYSTQLANCFHNYLLEKSTQEKNDYEKERNIYNIKLKKAKTNNDIDKLKEPVQPKFKLFFIPGDTSSAMFMRHLEYNDGMGCMAETEADSLTKSLKQEWGGFSDILRKGFQGEVITSSRVTDLKYIQIKDPKFSIALTGTPNQLGALMTSVDDGLFSRFIFYSFNQPSKWNPTYTTAISKSKREIFQYYSQKLCDKFKSGVQQKFSMTKEQGLILDNTFAELLNQSIQVYGETVSSTVFRLGLMCFKISMVLTAIKSVDTDTEIICSDKDFNIALDLVKDVYLPHSTRILKKVTEPTNKLNDTEKELIKWIKTKETFKRSEINDQGASLGIKVRSVNDLLKKFIFLKIIKKMRKGLFAKT